jgi:hypothetical protein
MELLSHMLFQCIKEGKVIHILKKPLPTTHGDYRQLSLLEMIYKIPSRVLAKRLAPTLPMVMGEHQHGFLVRYLPDLSLTLYKMVDVLTAHFN